MTNVTNDFTFCHGSGSVAPGVREVRDEYLRLERHELPTLEKKAIRFMPYRRDREDKQETTFAISHNEVFGIILLKHSSDGHFISGRKSY